MAGINNSREEKRRKQKKPKKPKLVAAISGKQKEQAADQLARRTATRRFVILLVAVFSVFVGVALATSGSWMRPPPKGAGGGTSENVDNSPTPADNAAGDNQPGN